MAASLLASASRIAVARDATYRGPLEQMSVVFIGSSTIEYWKSMKKDLFPHRAVNLGLGGTQYPYLIENIPAWTKRYPGDCYVIYSGDNDITWGATPETVLANFRKSVEMIHERLPNTRIFVLSIKGSPHPERLAKLADIMKANGLIKQEARRLGYVAYVDVFSQLIGPDGKPDKKLFLPDEIHLNREGYARVTKKLRGKMGCLVAL